MARYYGRRRYEHPTTIARREREREDQERFERNKRKFYRLMRQFRKVPLYRDEADFAWKQQQLRTFTIGKDSGGTSISYIIRRGPRGELYLQEPHFPGWRFSRLVPRYSVPRESEVER